MSTIILLEDDEQLRELYSLHLGRQGHTVIAAGNSAKIGELLYRHQPALIVTDLMMPDHEGMEAIFKIRDLFPVPVIAMSSNPAFLKMAAPLAEATLLKPFSGDELMVQVERLLRSQAES